MSSLQTSAILRFVYVLCLSGATFNHVCELLQGGWLPYNFAPLWTNVFWTALTFLDPLAISLLLLRPRMGVWITLVIMLADAAVNLHFSLENTFLLKGSLGLLGQFLFLGFVLGSCPVLLRRT